MGRNQLEYARGGNEQRCKGIGDDGNLPLRRGPVLDGGGNPAIGIAKWDGSSWSPLGFGVTYYVYALAVSGTDLYVGGSFTKVGGTIDANNVARWDGNNWSPLGAGTDGDVNALTVLGNDLYAGGAFAMAGDVEARRIARWDGNAWSTFGSGFFNAVYALAGAGGELYAAGNLLGSEAFTGVLKWDGSNWSDLGSGVNGYGRALAISGSDLYLGGDFTSAGGKVSAFVARAYLERPTLTVHPSGGDVKLSWPVFYDGFELQQNPDAADINGWVNSETSFSTNGTMKSATVPLTPPIQFFRLREP